MMLASMRKPIIQGMPATWHPASGIPPRRGLRSSHPAVSAANAASVDVKDVTLSLEDLWAEHLDTEFVAKSADLAVATMVPDSYVCVSLNTPRSDKEHCIAYEAPNLSAHTVQPCKV